MTTEHTVGGVWGDAINWINPSLFEKGITTESRYGVIGWKQKKPEVGDTLKGEFAKSWIYFEFVEVEKYYDPPDMFRGVVRPIRQEMKEVK